MEKMINHHFFPVFQNASPVFYLTICFFHISIFEKKRGVLMNNISNNVVKFRGKNVDVYDTLKRMNIDQNCYDGFLWCGLSPQEAFDLTVKNYWNGEFFEEQNLIGLNQDFDLKQLREQYSSLKEFCICHKLQYRLLSQILRKNPHYTIPAALEEYLYHSNDPRAKNRSNHVFYGISLSAICLEYQLDIDFCSKRLMMGLSLEQVLDEAILQSPMIPKKISEKLWCLTSIIQVTPFKNLEHFAESLECDEEMKECIYFYHQQYHRIHSALNVYRIIDYLENGWENDPKYGKEFQALHQNSKNSIEFYKGYDALKKRVRKEILAAQHLTEKKIAKYKAIYYKNYLSATAHEDEQVWIYNRKKMI